MSKCLWCCALLLYCVYYWQFPLTMIDCESSKGGRESGGMGGCSEWVFIGYVSIYICVNVCRRILILCAVILMT